MSSQLLTEVPDAARRIGVGRTMLYQLAAAGEIEFVKIGRKTLVPVASLESYVERLRAIPTAGGSHDGA